ncbi:hypothetical protein GCM10011360_25210 [Primorskyibacter flagellatus]|uniref:VPLPA-CTERM protein sorting domain-containing protein n=1 Tax=Primorskyibacter flagellatus TaxID=1387277 RepID=A0A917A9B5_9RHOB|nr:hypothetical protein [Primorskyibacter flagellatus]GGE36403.1 hypothetical protein GCM10011360_25210 [Primorskyibacter flagellatus]
MTSRICIASFAALTALTTPAIAATTFEYVADGTGGKFTTLPSVDPTLFGFAADASTVDFEGFGSGGAISTQYLPDFTVSGAVFSSSVYGGAASGSVAAYSSGGTQTYSFTSGLSRVGIINTSPDKDRLTIYDKNGIEIATFRDQESVPSPNYNIDRFLGFQTEAGEEIWSLSITNLSGNLEMDDLVYSFATPAVPLPAGGLLLLSGLAGLALRRR